MSDDQLKAIADGADLVVNDCAFSVGEERRVRVANLRPPHRIIECMHVHASDSKPTEGGSAKFLVKRDDDTIVRNKGKLSDREIRTIRRFIKVNYHEMYLTRSAMSDRGFYGK